MLDKDKTRAYTGENENIKFNLVFLNKILFSFILILSSYYVMNINNLAIKGFALQELKQEVKELDEEKKTLNLEITYLRSYSCIDKKIKESNFVSVNNIEYFDSKEDTLAMR